MKTQARPPWWVLAAAAVFFGYHVLLVYCDIWRPAAEGLHFTLSSRGITVTATAAGSAAERAGIRPGDILLACDSRPVRTRLDWMACQASVSFDRPLVLSIARNDEQLQVHLLFVPDLRRQVLSEAGLARLGVRLVQWLTLVMALVVVLKRPSDLVARVGAWLLATLGVFSLVWPYRFATVWRALPWWAGLSLWLPYLSSLAVGAVLFTFFAMFPRVRLRGAGTWLAVWSPMALALIPGAYYTADLIYRPSHVSGVPDAWAGLLLLSVGYLAAGVATLIVTYRGLADINERRRVRVVGLAAGIGCAWAGLFVPVFWRSSSDLTLYGSAWTTLGTLALLIVPLSFGYAIVRHRLLDIRIIIRQGVRYAAARGLLLSLVPLIVAVLAADVLLHRTVSVERVLVTRGWIYLLLAGTAVALHLRRRRWLDALDRRFYRERYDANQLLCQLVGEIRRLAAFDEVLPIVTARIEAALHPTFVSVLVSAPPEPMFRVVAVAPADAHPPRVPAGGTFADLVRVLGRPLEIAIGERDWLHGQLPDEEIEALQASGVSLLAPVAVGPDRLDAVLALGARRSEEPYTREDRDLVGAIAASLALVHQRGGPWLTRETALEQCPSCGRCFDAGTTTCADEGTALVAVPVPRWLASRYRLDRRLGRGGMGNVYQAQDMALDRAVAVKLVREDLAHDRQARARFESEAKAAAAFTHPNVVTVHDFGVAAGGHAYLVMELLRGVSLRDELRRVGRLEVSRVVRIMQGVGAAVQAAHDRQIIHRDLKPENIVLVGSNGEEVAKILDFGIAKIMAPPTATSATRETAAGMLVGTPQYMAPEQLRGEPVQPAWDLWAMAVVAYELIVGRLPLATDADAGGAMLLAEGYERAIAAPLSSMPPQWCQFFCRVLALDPAVRPATARAFVSALERAASSTP